MLLKFIHIFAISLIHINVPLEKFAFKRIVFETVLCLSVKDIQTYRTAVDVMLKNLSPNAKRLMDVGKTLDFNVKALRDKIELAREQANRVSIIILIIITRSKN